MRRVLDLRSFALALLLSALALMPLSAAAGVQRDIAYGQDRKQKLDLYRPDAPQNAPIVIMVHGGAWAHGDKGNQAVWRAKSAHYLSKGYLFIAVNNRLLPQADPLNQARDVAKAIAYVQSHARSWGGDPQNIALMGHSAGAHLVALLGANPRLAASEGARPWKVTVALDTASLDIPQSMQNNPPRFLGKAFGNDPRYWVKTSPRDQLTNHATPFILACSTQRRGPCLAARQFATSAQNTRAKIIPADLSHKNMSARLGEANAYTKGVDAALRHFNFP